MDVPGLLVEPQRVSWELILHENWSDLPRLSEESRRLRGDARPGARGRARAHATTPPTADVLVVNTCAFIDSAKQESIDAILEMAQHKKDGACQRLIVTGCLRSAIATSCRAEIPEIDAVLGTGEVPEIVDAIGGARAAGAVAARRSSRGDLAARRRQPQRRRTQHRSALASLHLRRRHAAAAGDAEALRVREDRRGLRLQVRVLHHPDAARRATAAARPTRSSARRARSPRAASRNCC